MKLDLNEIKKRLRTRSALAITVESGRMAVNLVRNDEKGSQPGQAFSVALKDEEILEDPDKAGQQLVVALASAGIRERNCVVCVPPGWALTASTDLPEVGAEDLRGYLELRAEREFSMPSADLRLGFCAYALPNGQRRATLAALSAKKIEAVERMLAVGNRRASSISLALDKCLSQQRPMLHFLTNGTHTDVVVTAGGGVAGLRSLAGPHAAGDTAFDPAAFCRDVRITLGRLPEPVRQQIRHAAFSGPSAEKLCGQTRYDLSRMGIESPDFKLTPAPAAAAGDAPGAAAEAALRKLRDEPIAFEFVVPETKRWQMLLERFDTSRRRRLVFAAAGLVLLPVLLFFIRSQIEGHLGRQWSAMKTDADDLDGLQKNIRLYQPWFKHTPQGLQVVAGLVSAFPDQGDVWAKSIQVAEGYKISCTGFAKTRPALFALLARLRARADISALQLQQTRGENPIEFTIAYQWQQQHD